MLPAGDPARADHQVGVVQGRQQAVQLLGLVGPVGVHLADHVVAAVQGHPEAVEVRRPQALLAGPVQHRDLWVGGRDRVCDRASAVRGVVVDDEEVHVGLRGPQAPDEQGQVERLVVRRNDHHHPAEARNEVRRHGENLSGGERRSWPMGPPAGEAGGTTLIDENGRAGGEKRPSDRSRPGRIPEPQALSTGHLTPPVSSRRDHPSDSPSASSRDHLGEMARNRICRTCD